ncbi:MAG TPA: UvrD-helicase domain-containing protein [Candidatus Eisenbacteria bacterium]|jgi:DNA helicase-2/ATP-dependent DNA helicase PcrA
MNSSLATALSLNPAQRAAVEHPEGPLLVVAGAGSGKTRVLTARVARLLESGVPPERILAFTFTNRAAREMRERIERAAGGAARPLWVGTFHGTGLRILRREAESLGLPPGFAVYDREDQDEVLHAVLGRMGQGGEARELSTARARISDAKNALVPPEEMARLAISPAQKRIAECYAAYDQALRANGALDFDDLITGCVKLFRERPEIGERYAARFEHVLVDEYQDTNHAQFRLVEWLARAHRNLFVVGDDDQSIYGWRGADRSNVLDFEGAFPGATVIRLEQNYRSTGNILKAANAVIANNRARHEKRLWCEREDGPKVRFVLTADEGEEARRIRQFLADRQRAGRRLDECAVLYRTHAQSRALETELRLAFMPYQIVGGVAFYQRREVKDLISYLRLAANPADAVSFWRVWNTPRRGLGAALRARVEACMAERALPPLAALRHLAGAGELTAAAQRGAAGLLGLMDELAAAARAGGPEAGPDWMLSRILERTDYLSTLAGEEQAEERRANIEELASAVAAFGATRGGTLVDFLAEAALVTDGDRLEEGADRVLMLTAHNAKGLEFPVVIVAGLEEGLFPHAASSEDEAELEEERRLFYVALTRAADQVLLTAAAYRRRFDGPRGSQVSRFVAEIPDEVLEREATESFISRTREKLAVESGARPAARRARLDPLDAPAARHKAVGRAVYHETFGRGVVVDAEGDGPAARFTVRFGAGIKKVLGRFLSGGDDGDHA